jgi:hypothetical protein
VPVYVGVWHLCVSPQVTAVCVSINEGIPNLHQLWESREFALIHSCIPRAKTAWHIIAAQ